MALPFLFTVTKNKKFKSKVLILYGRFKFNIPTWVYHCRWKAAQRITCNLVPDFFLWEV